MPGAASGDFVGDDRWDFLNLSAVGGHDRLDQLRLVDGASVGDRRVDHRHLQGCHSCIALTDRGVQRVTFTPSETVCAVLLIQGSEVVGELGVGLAGLRVALNGVLAPGVSFAFPVLDLEPATRNATSGFHRKVDAGGLSQT